MKNTSICALVAAYLTIIAHAQSLRGTVTDPSGALVPSALVQLRGPGPEQRATTDDKGQYAFVSVRPGNYTIRVIAKGFSVNQKQSFEITSAKKLDVQLTIEPQCEGVNVVY